MSGGIDVAEGGGEEQTTDAHTGTPDIFISYASQDAAVANAVVAALEGKGIKCWIAPRDVTPGALYADEIIRSINGAKALVVVLSKSAVASPHVGKEVERASSKRRPIITLRTDTTPLTNALEYFLSESQWVDLAGDGTEVAFAKIVNAVRADLTADNVVGPSHRGGTPQTAFDRSSRLPVGVQPNRRVSRPAVVSMIVIALVVGYVAVDRLWLSKHETVEKLKAVAPAAASSFNPPLHSIAVLPFVNMSGDAKQDYFSDGISEELLDSLSRLNDLQVAARTSSFSFKGQNVDVSTIAHKLNVGTILEGSVRRAGKTVRITVQLIDAVSGFHIWSETYDRTLSDILKVQTEVATSVAQKLKIQMSAYGSEQLAPGSTNNAEAYDAYLRGVQLYTKAHIDQSGVIARSSLEEFDRAVSLDSEFAQAYAKRADGLLQVAQWEHDQGAREIERAQALTAAQQAVALAPALGEAHLSLGSARLDALLDIASAAPEFDRALLLAPGSARVQAESANFAYILGHFDSAVRAARRAVILDPQNISAHIDLTDILTGARRFDEARVALEDASILHPASRLIAGTKANLLLASGQIDSAVKHCESPNTPLDQWARSACLALAYNASGRRIEAERELETFQSIEGESSAVFYAGTYAQWGNQKAALKWLSTAERLRDPGLMWLRVSWEFDPIRNNPEFRAIEARLKFPR